MVSYQKFTLENGLRVLIHEDHNTAMACVNILYDVGARDESPEQTGFAHLFEHLMFGGSVNIPNFDTELQKVGGENNAFTSNDITNYYITLPSSNLETALWLESDRMLSLAFSPQSLEVQRNVVSEEFKQRYLNQPYGDAWLKLRPLAYKVHPYRWATIGKELKHIEDATMADVKAFFKLHYNPQSAIMVISGDVYYEEVKSLVEKWFADIEPGQKYHRQLPQEPVQQELRRETAFAPVPLDALYMAFHGPARLEEGYFAMDLLSDILSRGSSSRLYRRLVKGEQVFSELNAYVMGSIDNNLFVIEGKPSEGITLEEAERAVWGELDLLKKELVSKAELEKVKNKIESTNVFAELSILDKAMNLAFHELLGDANGINTEVSKYLAVTAEEVQQQARAIFNPENASILMYKAQEEEIRHVG
ncbi:MULTISPECIES: M16 family metallopeptidase [Sphingobacterium]|uniref:Peptidase M16 n=1 Tax=Sphingobacterium athyrii TaxID=2152717 RepID=A0A363NT96_9SPHI|nr:MULTISPECIES: pitrilysin family protein [Sphingobacterium]PUV23881.1 peptidase M16 [Sphingobacterium athyrii]QIH34350.1 insulinase family protein [Sphingobacterium sp. DR205]